MECPRFFVRLDSPTTVYANGVALPTYVAGRYTYLEHIPGRSNPALVFTNATNILTDPAGQHSCP